MSQRPNALRDWLIWQVFLPSGVAVLAWLAAEYLAEVDSTFVSAFATPDLTLYAALLLIGVWVQFRLEEFFVVSLGLMIGMLLLVWFGCVKAAILMNPTLLGAERAMRLANGNFAATAVAISIGVYAHLRA